VRRSVDAAGRRRSVLLLLCSALLFLPSWVYAAIMPTVTVGWSYVEATAYCGAA